ncbi:acyl-CoA dehydrogenase family protein [Micromonospora sp. WMMA1363]|uniref:acyl-CoA dehydrogenase family protein n=1 Tax=Micromonospora sp. WMMA1363 TaxID=3053985 RepID=UPI00259C7818|nr:acyl-CoA dehydrogenase family protein [Micromonospora sp. WMMA1363]MDM4719410.1 acyl-CoA dehydrogenase family protein [Micromonospora sp. WMMA1363]
MNLDLDDEVRAFRAEVRSWLTANVPTGPLPPMDTADGDAAHRAWERHLAQARLSVVSWPTRYGGRAVPPLYWLIFEEEYHAARAPARINQNGLFLLAPTLFTHGTAEQRGRLLPRMARADDVWAQAWSEPDAGSDLAGIRSRAARADGGWLLSGQKTWSTRATHADRAFGLFRTGADRHRGLTYLMFDLRAEGVTVRPIRQLGGAAGFAEIFLDGVFVPDADVLGEVNQGWAVAMSTAGHERGLSLRSPGRFTAAARRLVRLWRQTGHPADPTLRDRVVDAWVAAQAYRMHGYGTVSQPAGDRATGPTTFPSGSAASMTKVFWSDLDVALHEVALDLLGPHAETGGVRTDTGGGADAWLDGYLFSLAGPIYAGTNEIQRTVIAERVLGLPRDPR